LQKLSTTGCYSYHF